MNMLKFSTAGTLMIALLLLSPGAVRAGECFSQPIVKLDGTATANSGVFLRTVACMEGSEVIETVSAGESLTVLSLDDGWYEVQRSNGTTGWVWGSFLTIDANPTGIVESAEKTHTEKTYEKPETTSAEPVVTKSDTSLLSRTRGYILLQVEDHGEAWYVHPEEDVRYYMKDGPTAYEMMRAFGLGITDADLASLKAGDWKLRSQLKGRIVLQVEQHGEAYYVHPKDGSVHYMKDGEAAYSIMRSLSLGTTNKDLSMLATREFKAIPYKDSKKTVEDTPKEEVDDTVDDTETINYEEIQLSVRQHGIIPTGVDVVELNKYWLELVNDLRREEGLRELVLDQRWVDTASDYAGIMYEGQYFAHERPDGTSMHQWIDAQDLDFTDRYAVPDGWRSNYFTENITWGYAGGTTAEVKDVLNDGLAMYLGEASYNGAHYRTIYHEDWNTVGLGFYFEDKGTGDYKVYVVMHYGSLAR